MMDIVEHMHEEWRRTMSPVMQQAIQHVRALRAEAAEVRIMHEAAVRSNVHLQQQNQRLFGLLYGNPDAKHDASPREIIVEHGIHPIVEDWR